VDLQGIGKIVALMGLALIGAGLMLWLGGRLGLGSLPGDLRITNEDWGCYVPIASMIILSVLLTIIVNVVLRLFDR
jgi:hypothetical protein